MSYNSHNEIILLTFIKHMKMFEKNQDIIHGRINPTNLTKNVLFGFLGYCFGFKM